VVDYPFVIPGASPVSTAGQGAERSDRGSLRSTEHIARFGAGLQWNDAIPEFYSPHTVWAYSICKALEQVPELGVRPHYGRLYASCLMYCRGHGSAVRAAMGQLAAREGWPRVIAQVAGGLTKEAGALTARLARKLLNPRAGGSARRLGPHETISAAYLALVDEQGRTNIGLDLPQQI
jgi:hypothetical protein